MPTATKLMNTKRRVIFQSDRGAFYVKEGDKKLYGVKAAFKKSPNGGIKKLSLAMTNNVPLPIRPMKRGAPVGPRPGTLLRKMNTESRKTYRITSPGGTSYSTQREANIAAFLKRISKKK